MSSGRAAREAWKTFTVSVREVRGHAAVEAVVSLSSVSGRPGTAYPVSHVFVGEIGRRSEGHTLTPEEAAEYAVAAIRRAYPGLF